MGKEVDKLIADLWQENSLKVWSLIITFFGDAVVTRGGNVSAKTVQTVLTGMHVGNGAVRTACSRLVSDQWIVRQKIGRESFYELADEGYRPFKVASVRIYSALSVDSSDSNRWTLAVKDQGIKTDHTTLLKRGVQISANSWLFKDLEREVSDSLADNEFMVISGELGKRPGWLNEKLIPHELKNSYLLLQKQFSAIEHIDTLEPLECLIVRCLLIHQWRRLLLRSSALPNDLLSTENNCRQFVANLYGRLLPGSEAWLDENATCANGKMPPSVDVELRFTT